MKEFPSVPLAAEAPPELFESGHLWIQELVDGDPVRFQLTASGVVQFGDRTRVFDADEVPEAYRHVVRHVRERLDREALREAVGDPESVVFFGTAVHRTGIDYDWDRVPSFLGFDVWSGESQRFLPPDAVEQSYDRLGLAPVNVFDKEVRAADFDPDAYEIPASNWYDGPAAGVVVRNKTGLRARIPNSEVPDAEADATGPITASPEELASRWVAPDRIEAIADELAARGRPATFDAVYERVLDALFREKHAELTHRETDADRQALRSAVAARTQELVDGRE